MFFRNRLTCCDICFDAQMTVLAYWLEVTKMRSNMTLSLLGGALLGEALTYLNAAEAGVTQPTSVRSPPAGGRASDSQVTW